MDRFESEAKKTDGFFWVEQINEPPKSRAPGWLVLGHIGDEMLPIQLYIGDYLFNHEIRIPELTNQDSMESRRVFFVAQMRFSGWLLWVQRTGVREFFV